jgi:hypothetical protein
MALMKISEYLNQFTPDSRPDPRTVKSWILNGHIYGEQRGRNWYVDPYRPLGPTKDNSVRAVPDLDELSPIVRKIIESGFI